MKFSPMKFANLFLVVFASALITGCTPQARKGRHEAKADKYYDAGQYPQAEVEYLNVAKLDNKDAHAISRLGLIYFEEGRSTRAYPFLMRAKELDSNNLQVRLKAGFLNLALGNTKGAREEAIAILDQDPKYPEAAFLLAETVKKQTDADIIRQQLDKVVQQAGVTAGSEIGFGTLDFHAGNFKNAKVRFTHAQTLDPNSGGVYYALGILQWAMNDLTNADRSLKKAAELSPPRAPQRLGYADFKLKTEAVEEGKQLLNEITKSTPDYLPAWISLAEVALAQKHYDECTTLIGQVQARDPDNSQSLLISARLKLVTGRIDEAIAEYERLAARFKSSPQVFFQLGLACLYKDDTSKALRNFNEAVSLDPNFEAALVEQAKLNIQKENPDPAITSLTQLIKRRPQNSLACLILAGAYAVKGNYDEAIATCRRLEKLHPESPQVPFVIGGFLLKRGKKAEARQEFIKAQNLSPDFLPAMEQLVSLDVAEKNPASALARVQAEIDRHPDFPELHALRAQIFITQTNLVPAESALKKAIELDATYLRAYFMLANLYVSSQKNNQALKELNQIVVKTNDVTALMLIGMIQNEQHNYPAARATYEKLLEINPAFVIALNNLACLYSEQFGLTNKAVEVARKARDLAPHDPASSDTLGWILFKRGEYSWALSLLQGSAEKLPDEPEVLFHLGMTYYMMNDEARARNAFFRALAVNKEFPGKEEARKRLALLSLDFTQAGADVISNLDKRIAEQPDDPIALSHLAAIYEKQGSREKAIQVYEQVLKQNSNNPKLLITLARLYSEHLNNPQKALDLAKEAYKLAPEDADIPHTLGRLVFASGQYKWALSLLQQSARKQSADPELLYDLAWALYSVGQVPEAESTMHDALQSNPAFAHAAEAGRFLDFISFSNDPAKAAQASSQIKQWLQADPNSVPALLASATASESRGDINAASEACEQILKRYPDFMPAVKKLAVYYSEALGKEQRAYELAVKARGALPQDAEVAKALGIISYRRGDFQAAARLLNQSAKNGTKDGKTFYYLGMAEYQLKHMKESRNALGQALTNNLPGQLAKEARRVLGQIK
jgi:tetratricopeptide (TPR) repeat protein